MNTTSANKSNGYYHVHIRLTTNERFFKSNNERAFVGVQLQQLLAARSVLEDPLYAKSLAHHIDLLAFSLSEQGIQLLAYCIDISSLQHLISLLLERLSEYKLEYQSPFCHTSPIKTSIYTLAGKHQALAVSADIHMLHTDWEYDRYSSIGFYLHDRRGDWMKLWRLTQLYNNDASMYRDFIQRSKIPMLVS